MTEEILVVKKAGDKMKFKICDKGTNNWSPKKYEKIIASRDFNLLAFLFYDLHSMGYPVERAYLKYKNMLDEPEFFLK